LRRDYATFNYVKEKWYSIFKSNPTLLKTFECKSNSFKI
jgi:hypothetical protein